MFEEKFFVRRKPNVSRLLSYGFTKSAEKYEYATSVLEDKFILQVFVFENGGVSTKMIDRSTDEEYSLYKVASSVGSFVGKARAECEEVLTDISQNCFDPDVFKSAQTLELIAYVRKKYGDEPEYLWDKFPDNAVWRRKDTKKWYGAVLTVAKSKLGLKSDDPAEVLDLRLKPELMESTVDFKNYFPGWHMNKKSWYTVILDNSLPTDEICRRIDESFRLAVK